MILCAGDSFSVFNTPLGNGEYTHGLSAVELLIEKLDTTGTSIGWSGASIDATVAKTVNYIINNNNVKFLFFYLTANVRIMYSTKTTHDYHFADSGYDDPHFFNDQEILNVHSNDGKGHTPDALQYFLHQPTYKKYLDRYAYLNLLTNVCSNRGINILYINTTQDQFDPRMLLNNADHVRSIDLDTPTSWDLKTRLCNHLFPHEQKAFSEKILNSYESFILASLQK